MFLGASHHIELPSYLAADFGEIHADRPLTQQHLISSERMLSSVPIPLLSQRLIIPVTVTQSGREYCSVLTE